MDFSESMKVVFQRIQKLDPENVPKIIGHLLLQNFGEQEMIRLAFSPDNMIQSLIEKAKRDLGLPTSHRPQAVFLAGHHQYALASTSSPPPPPNPRGNTPFVSNLPTNFIPFTPGGSTSSSPQFDQGPCEVPFAMLMNQPHLLIHNSDHAPVVYFDPGMNQPPHFVPFDHHQMDQYYNVQNKNHCREFARPDHQRSPQFLSPNVPNLSVPICEFFTQGYCKYGANCKFLHVLRMENGYMMVLNPPNDMEVVINGGNHQAPSVHEACIKQLEIEMIEILKSRNGIPVPVASLPVLYREKYGRKLQAFDYLADHTRSQGNFCCVLSQLLSQMTDTIRLIDTPQGQPCLILTEAIPRYIKFIEERNDHEAITTGLCQVYLTFPPQSTFSEQDVFNYFSLFGPVQDVRIPSQDRRMYGFVTFIFPETVTLALTQGNPHFICGAQVLVKPYRTKAAVDSKRQEENIQSSMQNNSCSSDAESKPLSNKTPTILGENVKILLKQPIEDQHGQTVDPEKNPITEMEATDSSGCHSPHSLHCSTLPEGTLNNGSTSEGEVEHINTPNNDHHDACHERLEEVNLPDSPFGCELLYGDAPSYI